MPSILDYKIVQYSCVLIVCCICYGCSLEGQFVFDDSVAIVGNSDVTNPNISLSEIFQHDFWGAKLTETTSHKSFRPLTTIFFRLEHSFFGLDADFMKLTNFLLHCLCSCLLIPIYGSLINAGKGLVPFYGAILFSCHSIHTEVVSGIVGRAELMVALIFLLSIGFFIKRSKKLDLIVIFGMTTIALLFKENGITILPMCIFLDLLKNTKILQNIQSKKFKDLSVSKEVVTRILILLTLSVIVIYARMRIMNFETPKFNKMDNPSADPSCFVLTRILTQNFLYVLNFWLLLCPDWLCFDWALGSIQLVDSLTDLRIFSILIFYIYSILILLRGSKTVLLSLFLIIIPFIPASGIIKVGFVIAERVLYIPSIGFCLLVAIGFDRLLKSFQKFKLVFYALFSILVIFMVLKTRVRSKEWSNEENLFKSALRVCPNNAKVYYNIARLATDKNDRETAFNYYHRAIELYPEYESALMNLGNLYRESGDLQKAESLLLKSVEILEEFPAAWMNLGIVQSSLMKYEEGIFSYQKAIKYRKNYAHCYYNWGNLYVEIKDFPMALKSWEKALSINPKHNKAWANILALLDNQGLTENLLQTSEKALSFIPDDPSILFSRANAFGKLGKFAESEEIFLKVIKLKPNTALYNANLGVLYHRWNKKEKAIEFYNKALLINPNLKSAKDNLRKLIN